MVSTVIVLSQKFYGCSDKGVSDTGQSSKKDFTDSYELSSEEWDCATWRKSLNILAVGKE